MVVPLCWYYFSSLVTMQIDREFFEGKQATVEGGISQVQATVEGGLLRITQHQ